jgi:adenylyltransferase/sulfurtransferase
MKEKSTERYARQILFGPIGRKGQEKIRASHVVVVGCGALGTNLLEAMARAGVGRLRVVDRDFLEISNLQRQILFDEEDLEKGLPKAIAAERKLKKINSEIEIDGVVEDVTPGNVERLLGGFDLILDGTDNFRVRMLLNDVSLKLKIPWIYTGVVASYGHALTVLPDRGPCFRCYLGDLPPDGSYETTETAGVLGSIAAIMASFSALEALKILAGHIDTARAGRLLTLDGWSRDLQEVTVARDPDCPACAGRFEFLAGKAARDGATLSGLTTVQIPPRKRVKVDFEALAKRIGSHGQVRYNPFLLRFQVEGLDFAVFRDGRAIVRGTGDTGKAEALYDKYVGP